MIDLVASPLGLLWFFGWTMATYPVYRAIEIANQRQGRGAEPSGLVAALATVVSFFWPLFLPFALSVMIHTKRFKADLEGEAASARDRIANDKLHEASRKAARQEIEAAVREMDGTALPVQSVSTTTTVHERLRRFEDSQVVSRPPVGTIDHIRTLKVEDIQALISMTSSHEIRQLLFTVLAEKQGRFSDAYPGNGLPNG